MAWDPNLSCRPCSFCAYPPWGRRYTKGYVTFLRSLEEGATQKLVLLEEAKIESAVEKVRRNSFTVLDFADAVKKSYPEDWRRLVKRFGEFGEKRRYTVTTYLANRLDIYSQKPASLLKPLTHYSEGKMKDRRRTSKEEQRHFGSPWIAIFTKRRSARRM
jgi:hypothetical protein